MKNALPSHRIERKKERNEMKGERNQALHNGSAAMKCCCCFSLESATQREKGWGARRDRPNSPRPLEARPAVFAMANNTNNNPVNSFVFS